MISEFHIQLSAFKKQKQNKINHVYIINYL